MTKLHSIVSRLFLLPVVACSTATEPGTEGGVGGAGTGGSGTAGAGGFVPGSGGTSAGTFANASAGRGTSGGGSGAVAGAAGSITGISGGSPGTAGSTSGGGSTGGAGVAGMNQAGGSAGSGTSGTGPIGAAGSVGAAGSGPVPVVLPPLVTSAPGAYWKTDGAVTDGTASANVTVNDTATAQKWDGFGGAFNELGWSYLTSADMQKTALTLLFSATDGAAFAWGRIPIGASDYAVSRYTEDDTGTDVTPNADESNRPAADTALASFSLDRDRQKLIPYIKAALTVNPALRFWASPWTPPVWMKTSYKKSSGADSSKPANKPSYFDGGNMTISAETLTAYAQYYGKFVAGYLAEGIKIEVVSPQNEPGYDQNYPSCLWDAPTYTAWVGQYLGPVMQSQGVKVMLGTLSNAGDNNRSDIDIATAVLANAAAKSFLSVAGAQWGVLDKVNSGTTFGGLPIWATEHKCGNYPWCTQVNDYCPSVYNSSQAPNDQAYGVESWGYIRNAISKGKVTAYNAWNMVLDKSGLGIDTTREWKQDALLVADGGKVTPTPAYYVFRHLSQYVVPGATVLGTTGGDALAFKNPDGSLIVTLYNSGAANPSYVVAMGGKKLQFAMPSNGWATLKYKP
jgi:glucosylceramidase